jgi:hypothetical protein
VPILRNSLFQVYELPGDSYFQVGDTIGTIVADRADIGSQTLPYLRSALPGQHRYLTVRYAGARAGVPTGAGGGLAGMVLTSHEDLADGLASATVRLGRRAVVVFSASFDPGWSVTLDGHQAATQMIAPALVGVGAPAGVHRVVFRYTGFGGYPELLVIAPFALIVVSGATLRRRRPAGQ